jgi:hypothetical protein
LYGLVIEVAALGAKRCLHPAIAIATFMGMEDGLDLHLGIEIRIWFKAGINPVVIHTPRYSNYCQDHL